MHNLYAQRDGMNLDQRKICNTGSLRIKESHKLRYHTLNFCHTLSDRQNLIVSSEREYLKQAVKVTDYDRL